MPETRVRPHLRAGDQVAPSPLTVIGRHGGYDLSISTGTSWDGFALESSYLGSDQAGYHGTHLVLGRSGHRFAADTHVGAGAPTTWRVRALLDHYAVLQNELVEVTGETVCVELDEREIRRAGP